MFAWWEQPSGALAASALASSRCLRVRPQPPVGNDELTVAAVDGISEVALSRRGEVEAVRVAVVADEPGVWPVAIGGLRGREMFQGHEAVRILGDDPFPTGMSWLKASVSSDCSTIRRLA